MPVGRELWDGLGEADSEGLGCAGEGENVK